MPVRGKLLTATIGAAVLLMVVAIVWALGFSETSLRLVLRATARTSVTLFLLSFGAVGLAKLWPTVATHWLSENERDFFLAFTISHLIHLTALVALGVAFPDPFLSELDPVFLVAGSLVYVAIITLALTWSDSAAQRIGPKRWRILHSVGAYYIWLAFANAYVPRALNDPFYAPFAAAAIIMLLVRILSRARRAPLLGA